MFRVLAEKYDRRLRVMYELVHLYTGEKIPSRATKLDLDKLTSNGGSFQNFRRDLCRDRRAEAPPIILEKTD